MPRIHSTPASSAPSSRAAARRRPSAILRRLASASALVGALSACDTDDTDESDDATTQATTGIDPVLEDTTGEHVDPVHAPGAPDGFDGFANDDGEPPLPPDGVTGTGTATIPSPFGPREVTYEIVNGRALLEGDIDLGEVDERGELIVPRAAAAKDADLLWPNGDVAYEIDPNLVNPARVTAAIATLEARTAVRFHVRDGESDFIRFTTSTDPGVSSSPVGRQGGSQNLRIWTTHSSNTIVHELIHALGSWHEQTRPDRDSNIQVHLECILDDREHNFSKHTDAYGLEPYDNRSIMHYNSNQFCDKDSMNNCVCPTMTLLDGVTTILGSAGVMTVNDVNSLYRMYHRPVGLDEVGDEFGSAVARGDFDNDGYDDLAIGIAFEEIGSIRSGAVAVFKGNSAGRLIPWKTLTEGGLGVLEEGDEFGQALAAGDFDGDGFVDLAIGTPGESIGSVAEAGAVFIFRGSNSGLVEWQEIEQATAPSLGLTEAGDRFGSTLVTGDFNNDGRDDLAIGAAGEDAGSTSNTGWVFVFKGTTSGLDPWVSLGQGSLDTDDASDGFGDALAVGKINSDSYDDLVVGCPEWGSGPGSVFVFKGSASGPVAWKRLLQSDVGAANEEGDLFGRAVAVADFSGDGRDDIAVGGPGEDVGSIVDAGQVFMFKGAASTITGWQFFGQSGIGVDEAGDWFGTSLAAGEIWNSGSGNQVDLAVGAPGEDVGSVSNAGAAFVFSGSSTTMTARTAVTENTTTVSFGNGAFPASEFGDGFGRDLCIGDFDGDGDDELVVTVPNESDTVSLIGGVVHHVNNGFNQFNQVTPMRQSLRYDW